MLQNIINLLLILILLVNVSSKAQDIDYRYKTPSSVRLRNIEKLETHAKFFLIESGVTAAIGAGCLTAGLVKANKPPDYSAHFTKEQRKEYAERWQTSSKVLIGLGAGFTATSALLAAMGIKCIHDIKTRKPTYKLKLEVGMAEPAEPSLRLTF
jgi:hypothetical protein